MIPELSLFLLTLIANRSNYPTGKSKAYIKLDHIFEIATALGRRVHGLAGNECGLDGFLSAKSQQMWATVYERCGLRCDTEGARPVLYGLDYPHYPIHETATVMQQYQRDFIQLAIQHDVLCFGEFTLKSGRTSPYFFNAGKFQTGAALAALGRFYADALQASKIDYDLVFGPAYKGIPLAATTAVALADQHGKDMPYAFNRKEAKAHGEGGSLVGAPLSGKVLIVDDVITAGTAVREVMSIIEAEGAKAAAVLIGLNRQEKGQGELSAIQEVERDYGIPVVSIVCLEDIIAFLEEQGGQQDIVAKIRDYHSRYGV